MDDEDSRTLWVGNLDDQVTDELLYELFIQAGPLENVHKPKGKNYSFIRFQHSVSVPYSMELMSGVTFFGRNLKMQFRGGGGSTPRGQETSSLQRSYSAPASRQHDRYPRQDLMASPQLQHSHRQGRHDSYNDNRRRNDNRSHGQNQNQYGSQQNLNQLQMDIQRQLAGMQAINQINQQQFMQPQQQYRQSPYQQQQGYRGRYH